MKFRELVQKDISQTFFNDMELSQKILWDGVEVTAVIDEEAGEQRKISTGSNNNALSDYISKRQIIVSIVVDDIDEPVINQYVFMDNSEYKVISCNTEFGVYNITLEAVK